MKKEIKQYSVEQASAEAETMRRKIAGREAEDYPQAEKLTNEEREKAEEFFRGYREARQQAMVAEEKILQLLKKLESGDSELITGRTEAEQLLKIEIPTIGEDFSEQQLLEIHLHGKECRRTIEQLKSRIAAIETERKNLEAKLARNRDTLEEIDQGRIRKFLRRKERAACTTESANIETQDRELDEEIRKASRLIVELESKESDFRFAERDGLNHIVESETQQCSEKLEKLEYEGLFGTFLQQYIDKEIILILDRLMEEREFTPEESAEVRDEMAGQLAAYAQRCFDNRYGGELGTLESNVRSTMRYLGNDRKLDMATYPILGQEFGPYFKRMMDYLRDESQANLFPNLVKNPRIKDLLYEGRNLYGYRSYGADKMAIWNSFQQTDTGQKFPDEVMKKIDHGIRREILTNAYKDSQGEWIDQLDDCMDLEAFTALTLIQSARSNGYSRDHSSSGMLRMMKNPQWPQLAAQIREKYPLLDLTALEGRILSFDWDFNRGPDIEDLTEQMAQAIYEDESQPEKLRDIASESIPSRLIIEKLVEKGRLSPEEAQEILQAESLMKSIKTEWEADREKEKESREEPVYSPNYHSPFLKQLRTALADSVASDQYLRNTEKTNIMLKNLALLAKKINENSHKPGVLEFIGSNDVVDNITGKIISTERDSLEAYLESWKEVPAVLENDELRKELFRGMFAGDPSATQARESITFLKALFEKYGNKKSLLEELAEFVGPENIPSELRENPNPRELLKHIQKFLMKNRDALHQDKDELERFKELIDRKEESLIRDLLQMVNDGKLSRERALELASKGVDWQAANRLAFNHPEMILQTDETLPFLTEINAGGVDGLSPTTDIAVGRQAIYAARNGKMIPRMHFRGFCNYINQHQMNRFAEAVPPAELEINRENWQLLLQGMISTRNISPEWKKTIGEIFKSSEVKKFCLDQMFAKWQTYLEAGKPEDIPFSLMYLPGEIQDNGGAGHLSQLESFSNFLNAYHDSLVKESTTPKTLQEIFSGMARMEKRFDEERWSNKDRVVFYNISSDILGSAPSLFSSYLELFEKMNRSELAEFNDEIYPLHRVLLMLSEKSDRGTAKHEPRKLVGMRRDIRGLTAEIGAIQGSKKEFLKNKKEELIGAIMTAFKKRFGIIKVPDAVTPDFIRSMKNVSLYLSNLQGRDAHKEAVLGFYLALMVNGRWDDLRQGKQIDPAEYLDQEKSTEVKMLLEKREKNNPLTAEALGIPPEQLPEFQKMLQQESQNVAIGDVETVDVKISNIILNVKELEDPDLYPNPIDRERLQLLLRFGHKAVGATVAKIFREMSGKKVDYSEQESSIRQSIETICTRQNLPFQTETIKKIFQEEMKPLATLVNILSFIRESGAEKEIGTLRDILTPSENIISIFNRLGEDFSTSSGAMALSQDLSYLENLIVKRSDELQPEEKKALSEYLEKIKGQVTKLQEIYEQIIEKLSGLRKSGAAHTNEQLQKKIEQIESVIRNSGQEQMITSTMTGNLDVIIENMRACLACTVSGCNNDTNTTFGDANKFYLYSQGEAKERSSIADEIVFLEPLVRSDGSREISFVFDQIYETRTPAVLLNHLEAVLKKYKTLKKRFPDCKLSIFVSGAAGSSVGLSSELLRQKISERISKNLSATNETVTVEVAESAMGDHYIEFGGDARSAGSRTVSGVSIRSK